MIIIGERINSSRRRIAEAISSRDTVFIKNEALIQCEAGADYIDVNAAVFMEKEAEALSWVIEKVQEATDIPLCIDSPDPKVIKKIIPMAKKPPMINSITLEPARIEGIIPLVLEYGAKIIGLCQTNQKTGKSSSEKVEIAGQLVEKVTSSGIPIGSLYIDPLVFPVGADTSSALASLDSFEEIMNKFHGVHTVCGLTNVSHGLPNRKLVNRTFLAEAVARGLDAVILDPSDKQLLGVLKAALMLMGKDEYCMEYIKAFRKGLLD
jgi:5-methyltetrahydrofolate--homocysteine methyltransferase